MLFQHRRVVTALTPLHALLLYQNPVLAARFQREAIYHSVSPLSQARIDSRSHVAVRTLHVTSRVWNKVRYNSRTTKRSIAMGPPTPAMKPTYLSDEEYHEIADSYFQILSETVKLVQHNRPQLITKKKAGVLNIDAPNVGNYIIKKQPSTKQIWLRSPISGEKYYDWVMRNRGSLSDMVEREMHWGRGTGNTVIWGEWLYLEDGSNLSTLLNSELGLQMPEVVA